MRPGLIRILAGVMLVASASSARADLKSQAAREAAEYALKKFGLKIVNEGSEALSGRIASAVLHHGDDVLAAVRKVGPKALSLADEAGENAPRAMRFLTQHGDDAVRVLSRPKAMALFTRFGDDAAEALLRHKGVAEPLIEGLGTPAAQALRAVGPRGGRRLAMMAEGGELAAIRRTPELLGVVARHGDAAMEFIWRNKGALAVGSTLAAFLAQPKAFIDGSNQLVTAVAENAVKPVVEETAHAVSSLVWMLVVLVVGASGAVIYLGMKHPGAAAEIATRLLGLAVKGR